MCSLGRETAYKAWTFMPEEALNEIIWEEIRHYCRHVLSPCDRPVIPTLRVRQFISKLPAHSGAVRLFSDSQRTVQELLEIKELNGP